LENRVNTYLNQLAERQANDFAPKINFIFGDLEKFSAATLDKEKDVLYFPTLDDNRMLSAVIRSAGFDCFDNFDDETFDIQKTIKFGRQFAGDAVCAPFAAVLGDTMYAVRDYMSRRARGELKAKKKIVVFNNKGTGPCRQGQYYEMHRLYLHRELENFIRQEALRYPGFDFGEINLQFIVGLEKNNYNIGLKPRVLLQAFLAVMAQAVIHGLYLEGGSRCADDKQFKEFKSDYIVLKRSVIEKFEHGAGLFNSRGVKTLLREFSDKWLKQPRSSQPLKIHIEGEAYMRVAQLDLIFRSLIESYGFGSFSVTNSPLWAYLEYILELKTVEGKDKIDLLENKLLAADDNGVRKEIRKIRFSIIKYRLMIFSLRNILARPLYRAAGIAMPGAMREIIAAGREIFPTAKPYGELVPYTGEAIEQLRAGCDLFLNVAPEGCMVSSMGEVLSQAIYEKALSGSAHKARIQGLFSLEGEIDADRLNLALLKLRGPAGFFRQ